MTTTDLGARANAGKPRYDLIPADALRALAWVYTLGSVKYTQKFAFSLEEARAWLEDRVNRQSDATMRIALLTPSASVVSATSATFASVIRNTLSVSETTAGSGRNETRIVAQSLAPADGNVLRLDQTTPRSNGRNTSDRNMVLDLLTSRSFAGAREIAARFASDHSLPSDGFTLITTIEQDGCAASFAVAATTASECFAMMSRSLSALSPTFQRWAPTRFSHEFDGRLTFEISGDRNWERGLSWSDTLSSLMRHAEAIKAGEDYDAETRLPHAAHIAWNGMALTSMLLRATGVDDRAPTLVSQLDDLDIAARAALRTIENAMPLPKATMPFSPPKPVDETVSVVDLDEAAAQRELEQAIAQAAADRVSAAGGSEQ